MDTTIMTTRQLKYAVFNTEWGFFGLIGTEKVLLRTHLPISNREKLESSLIKNFESAQLDPDYQFRLQKQITSYFEGSYVNFNSSVRLGLDTFTPFTQAVLNACRKIEFGQTKTYGQLAQQAGHPKAARAIGQAMSKNPLPLIIPCHRIIRSDGNCGGFSASGGIKVKQRLLKLENRA
ncbi:MAG: methylated-DNA--[protein]-cysteine S-methyltransferase [Planctomycetota bacterium]|jgi:methylated-DNA-[protein]-cysteine S-methyltransferase